MFLTIMNFLKEKNCKKLVLKLVCEKRVKYI